MAKHLCVVSWPRIDTYSCLNISRVPTTILTCMQWTKNEVSETLFDLKFLNMDAIKNNLTLISPWHCFLDTDNRDGCGLCFNERHLSRSVSTWLDVETCMLSGEWIRATWPERDVHGTTTLKINNPWRQATVVITNTANKRVTNLECHCALTLIELTRSVPLWIEIT